MLEKLLFYILFSISIVALSVASCRDPGLDRKYQQARSKSWTYCDFCKSFRPPSTIHCSVCQVCVTGYDHHCMWIGKCVGKNNLFAYKLFLVSLISIICYVIILVCLLIFH